MAPRPTISLCTVCRFAASSPRQTLLRRGQTFSTSAPRTKSLPKLQPASSPELEDTLATLRDKVLLPGLLNKYQWKLVRDPKKKDYLDLEEVFVHVGEDEIRLRHINPLTDIPPRASVFARTLALTKEDRDWANWPELLRGFYSAKAYLDDGQLAKWVRMAFDAGHVYLVIRCLREVKKNGLSLKKKEVRNNVFMGLSQVASRSGWAEKTTAYCLKHAQNALECMEWLEHCGGWKIARDDARSEPLVIGVPLQLAANLAKLTPESEERKVLVLAFAKRLVRALEVQNTELNDENAWTVEIPELSTQKVSLEEILNVERLLERWLQVAHGLQTAKEVLESTNDEVLGKISASLVQIKERADIALQAITKARSIAGRDESEKIAAMSSGWSEIKS